MTKPARKPLRLRTSEAANTKQGQLLADYGQVRAAYELVHSIKANIFDGTLDDDKDAAMRAIRVLMDAIGKRADEVSHD
jgi:hypothetical protein